MKQFILLITFLFSVNAQAGLIKTVSDETTYLTNDLVNFEIWLIDVNPLLDSLEINVSYDGTSLAFEDNSWVDSFDLVLHGAFGNAFWVAPNTLSVQAFFLDGITNVSGSSFKLGDIQFTALKNIVSPSLTLDSVFSSQDFAGVSIEPQAVTEPSTLALLSLFTALLLVHSRKKRS